MEPEHRQGLPQRLGGSVPSEELTGALFTGAYLVTASVSMTCSHPSHHSCFTSGLFSDRLFTMSGNILDDARDILALLVLDHSAKCSSQFYIHHNSVIFVPKPLYASCIGHYKYVI